MQKRLLVLVCGLTTLVACQHDGVRPIISQPAVSLKEAKKITAEFKGPSFTPPPKTIKDITAILDQQKIADPSAIERARAAAHAEPPAGTKGVALAKFYHQRGFAARDIGDVRRQLADLREAERLSRNADDVTRVEILRDLSGVEVIAGNFADSIRHREQLQKLVPIGRKGVQLVGGTMLAVHYARAGNFAAANRTLGKSETMLREARSSPNWTKTLAQWGPRYRGSIERAKANLRDVRGRHAEAEAYHRAALESWHEDNRVNPSGVYGALHVEIGHAELAENLLRQGRLIEAEVEARKALTLSLAWVGRNSQDTALQIKTLVRVLIAQGRTLEAEQLAQALVDIFGQIGAPDDSLQLAFARAELGKALVDQERWAPALDAYAAIEGALADEPETYDQFFARDLAHAVALLGVGRVEDARTVAVATWRYNQSTLGSKHYNTAEALVIRAIAIARLGQQRGALDVFREALPILQTRSRQSDDESGSQTAKSRRLALILATYIDLLADAESTSGDAAEAFRVAEIARGQRVQQALVASGARAAARNPALADLVRREQDTLKQIAALYGLLAQAMSAPTDQRDAAAISRVRIDVDNLRSARAALAEEIERRFPTYAELVNPRPATIAATRAALRPGESLISTYVANDKTYVWAIPHTGAVAFASAPLGKQQIAAVVRDLRRALDPSATTLGDIPDFDVGLAHRLYKSLLAPVKTGWQGADSLLVVADGALTQLPFSVLVTKPVTLPAESAALFTNYKAIPWLARRHAITVLPSVTSLAALRALPAAPPDRRAFVGFGDPYFNAAQAAAAAQAKPVRTAALTSGGSFKVRGLPISLRSAPATQSLASADIGKLPRLPATGDELRAIALAMDADLTRDLFTGAQATEQAVKTLDLYGYKVLAFATHGLVPGDLDGLRQPALALTSPAIGNTEGDGLLTMGEILELRLDADWVVLSACNTGAGDGAGAEAFSGLGRAFFYAGTRAILLSNWPVETTSARELTSDLFRRQAINAETTRAEALRQSMLALIDGPGMIDEASGKTAFTYAHPIFWAPFSLVGDGGRPNQEPVQTVSTEATPQIPASKRDVDASAQPNRFDGRWTGQAGEWQVRIDVVGNRFRFWANCTGYNDPIQSQGMLGPDGSFETRAAGVDFTVRRIVGKFPNLTLVTPKGCGGGDFTLERAGPVPVAVRSDLTG